MTTRRSYRIFALFMALLPWATGCYSSRISATNDLAPGTDVALAITDRGRVALTSAIGPQVYRISGKLLSRTDSSLVLSVQSIEYLGGAVGPWNGESLTVANEYVGLAVERRLSSSRTWLLVGGIAAGLTALVAGTKFGGISGGGRSGGGVIAP